MKKHLMTFIPSIVATIIMAANVGLYVYLLYSIIPAMTSGSTAVISALMFIIITLTLSCISLYANAKLIKTFNAEDAVFKKMKVKIIVACVVNVVLAILSFCFIRGISWLTVLSNIVFPILLIAATALYVTELVIAFKKPQTAEQAQEKPAQEE